MSSRKKQSLALGHCNALSMLGEKTPNSVLPSHAGKGLSHLPPEHVLVSTWLSIL